MSRFCVVHGINNPDCKCDPFGESDVIYAEPVGIPQSTSTTIIVGPSLEVLQFAAVLLGMYGYEVTIKIEGEFREPLQRYARPLVPMLVTSAPMARIMRILLFVTR